VGLFEAIEKAPSLTLPHKGGGSSLTRHFEMTMDPSAAIDPKAWERHLMLPDGHAVFIRPIRPEDEALYGPFLAALTLDDVRMRLFVPVRELSHQLINYFTHVDYLHAMAFIALDEMSGAMLGVARLHNMVDDGSGEYAIIVRSDIKSHGLGWQLMQLTIDYARARGLRAIDGKVLHENTTMLKMCRELGFTLERDPNDAAVTNVRLEL
jgi:RimJ/RimL family protein N-acetyltransferase